VKLARIAGLISLCGVASLLAACPPKTSSVLVNAVGQPVSIMVIYRDQTSVAGSLPAGTNLSLQERFDALEAVEYRYGEQVCRLDRTALSKAPVNDFGKDEISLTDCREATAP
jgi:hypothetical protein